MKKIVLVAGGLGLAIGGVACPTRDLGPVAPVVQSGTRIEIEQNKSDDVDLLVMVDNSNSMAQEQENLTEQFQTMIDALTDPPDVAPANGKPDHPPVTDLHVGVISSDMGTGGFPVPSCLDSASGDDGILVDSSVVPGCEASYPRFLSFNEGEDPAVIAGDFACVATLGTGGCGFEQQLKAVRHALIDNAGEGAPNEGFIRDDSLLAILMVTDEEDCSVYEGPGHANASDIFNVNLGLGPLNLRCFDHRDQYVEPVSSYVDDILALRPGEPDKIVVAAIVGIPPGIRHQCNLEKMTDADFQCLLDLPGMREEIDQSAAGKGERLTPSCNEPGLGEAYPPRRIVDFVRQINQVGNNGIVRSICEDDFQPAMEAITSLIQSKFTGTCLERSLDIDPSGQVKCIIQEETTTTGACLPGRIDQGISGGHRLCQVCQEGDGVGDRLEDELGTDLTPCRAFTESGHFWRYLTSDQTGDECPDGKVEFLGATIPGPGSTVSLECLSQVGT